MSASDTLDRKYALRLWKVLEGTAACVAVALWVTAMFLWMYYDSTRPHVADPGTGRIYQLHTHGSIAYLTQAENFRLNALMLVAGICALIAICIEAFVRPFRRS